MGVLLCRLPKGRNAKAQKAKKISIVLNRSNDIVSAPNFEAQKKAIGVDRMFRFQCCAGVAQTNRLLF
jgi:hypothetical protein